MNIQKHPNGFTPYRGCTPFAFRRRNAQGLPMLRALASEPYRGCTPCGYFVSQSSQNLSQGPVKPPRGFTLVEILVVISIISLLSSVVFASVNSARAKARDAKRASDLRQIATALEFYYDTNGSYPAENCVGGTWALNRADAISCWNDLQSKLAPYLNKLPIDPNDTYPPTTTYMPYHYNSVFWIDSAGTAHTWVRGVNQGYVLLAGPETSGIGSGYGCWPGLYSVCVK